MAQKNLFVVLIVLFTIVAPALAARFWDEESYTSWTEDQCIEVLTDSPWVVDYKKIYFGSIPNWDHVLRFTLLTAKPVKLALARLQYLKNPTEKQKAKIEGWLKAPQEKDEIIFGITSFASPADAPLRKKIFLKEDMETFFLEASLEDFLGKTELVARKSKKSIRPSKYVPPGSQSPFPLLIFPRHDENGQPVFTGKEKSIELRTDLVLDILGGQMKYKVRLKLKPKKMIFKKDFTI